VIRGVEVLSPLCADSAPERLIEALTGRRILKLGRKGKHLLFVLDRGVLDIHLRMTGKLLAGAERTRHARVILTLDEGVVVFDDIRQFGRLRFLEDAEELALGPDALGISLAAFEEVLKAHRARIKAVLLNQEAIAGIGNIYADEALHAAGIHPRAIASRISRLRAARLHEAVEGILRAALAAGGSSISDYVDAGGQRGSFQALHQVYGRGGEACNRCGTAIRRILLNQRSTHFCPRCQRG
jgi:formamidopyrimidine-DNA glycosylase